MGGGHASPVSANLYTFTLDPPREGNQQAMHSASTNLMRLLAPTAKQMVVTWYIFRILTVDKDGHNFNRSKGCCCHMQELVMAKLIKPMTITIMTMTSAITSLSIVVMSVTTTSIITTSLIIVVVIIATMPVLYTSVLLLSSLLLLWLLMLLYLHKSKTKSKSRSFQDGL